MLEQLKISFLTEKNQLRKLYVQELCVLSGGGLYHRPGVCLDGSRFALRAAHQTGEHRAFCVFSLRS